MFYDEERFEKFGLGLSKGFFIFRVIQSFTWGFQQTCVSLLRLCSSWAVKARLHSCMGMARKKTKQVKKRGSKLSELAGNETQNLGTAHHSMRSPSLTHSAPGPLHMLCQGGGWAYLQHPSGPLSTDQPLPSSSLFCFFCFFFSFLCLCPTALFIILQSGCYHPFLASLQRKGKHSLMVQMVKNLPVMQEARVQSLGQEDPLAIHCSILAWRISWTEEPGRL